MLDPPPAVPLAEDPAEPPAEVHEAMRRHRREAHGLGFDVRRDVAFRDNHPKRATLTYRARTPNRSAAFFCTKPECRGLVFLVGDPPHGDPERSEFMVLWDPALRALTRGMDAGERQAFAERHERGEIGRELLHEAEAREAKRSTRRPRLADRQRIEGAQRFMLQRRTEAPRDEDAIWDLVQLRERDRKLYRMVTGGDRAIAYDTARKHWGRIPAQIRAGARKRWDARPEHEKRRLARRYRAEK